MSSIERGCFLIADISGYTRYLGGVELDHAQDILADLLGAVVANTSVMRTAKLEGDAVFCHAPTGDVDGPVLVDTIESCYFAFTRRRRTIAHLTTCACDACRRLDGLDLKFVVHCGQYAVGSGGEVPEGIGGSGGERPIRGGSVNSGLYADHARRAVPCMPARSEILAFRVEAVTVPGLALRRSDEDLFDRGVRGSDDPANALRCLSLWPVDGFGSKIALERQVNHGL